MIAVAVLAATASRLNRIRNRICDRDANRFQGAKLDELVEIKLFTNVMYWHTDRSRLDQ